MSEVRGKWSNPPRNDSSKQILCLNIFTPGSTESKNIPLTMPRTNRQQSLTYVVWVRAVCKQVQQLEISSISPFSKLGGKKKEIPWNTVTGNMILADNFSRVHFKATCDKYSCNSNYAQFLKSWTLSKAS